MKNKLFEELKEEYITHITNMIKDMGGIQPHITIFADQLDTSEEDKPAIIHMFIPGEYIDTDKGKDEFVNKMLPEVAKKVKQDFKPQAIGWASEAWMRTAEKGSNFDIDKDDYKQLPIKDEVVFITVEDAEHQEIVVYKIKREGSQVNQFGDLVDKIELEPMENLTKTADSVAGRFSGLFKHFKD